MLKRKWSSLDLTSYDQWLEIKGGIRRLAPKIAAFDTETTGLHIKLDIPFLFQFGYLHPNKELGYTYLLDSRDLGEETYRKIIREWHSIVKDFEIYAGHNVSFDLHMLDNIDCSYREKNLTDTQFYIRWGCDSLHIKEGGPPLGLKDFAARYITPDAKHHEKLLAAERTSIAKMYNNKLKLYTGLKVKELEDIFKDAIFDVPDLPENIWTPYIRWKNELPKYLQEKVQGLVESDMIRYDTLNKTNLHKYAHLDIVYTLEVLEFLKDVAMYRNAEAIRLENEALLPTHDMERVGFLVDQKYLEESRLRLKAYIIEQRKHLNELAGEEVKIGQHARIKAILHDKFGLTVESTGSGELANVICVTEAKDFITTIGELRSLEKWYSTYIVKFLTDLRRTDRIYTQINQVGTVSGRISCDFQQFPKEPLWDRNGVELYHPRRMVRVPRGCHYLAFIDESAEELRFTAIYTVLCGNPDTNMLRAYMPYKCIERSGRYFLEEQPDKEWEPVDLHAATTIAAGISPDDPNFKHYRKTIGKKLNFSKSYGAAYDKVRAMFPDKSEEECHILDQAYYKAFPGVKTYHQYCFDRAKNYASTANLFGVRYWNVNGHKLRNMLVQGSCAFFLKSILPKMADFLKDKKSQMVLSVHDELCFEIAEGEEWIIPSLKKIMEDFPDSPVPLVAEPEVTTTNWAEKEEWHDGN